MSNAIFIACAAIFSGSGVVFGLPAIYPSLYGLGYWAHLCNVTETTAGEAETKTKIKVPVCRYTGNALCESPGRPVEPPGLRPV